MSEDNHGIVDDHTTYGLQISFKNLHQTEAEEIAFVHGTEFGGIYGRMNSGNEAEIEEVLHAANKEIFERAAAALGWDIEIKPTAFDEWIEVTFTKTSEAKPNPMGLRVVK